MEPSTPPEQTPPTNPEPATNPLPPTESAAPSAPTTNEATPAASAASKLPSAFDLFQPSMKAALINIAPFLIIVLVPNLFSAITNHIQHQPVHWWQAYTKTTRDTATFGFAWLIVVIYQILTLGARPLLELRSIRKSTVATWEVIRNGLTYFWRLLGLYFIVGVLVILGLLLFIVPGLIMIRRYFLAPFFLIDKNLGIDEAMKQSAAATKKNSGAVWGVVGVTILLGLTGIIPIVGPYVAGVLLTLYACAPALRYDQLKA